MYNKLKVDDKVKEIRICGKRWKDNVDRKGKERYRRTSQDYVLTGQRGRVRKEEYK